jgi:hypothetical protein
MAKLELWRCLFVKIRLADAERVEVGDMVTANLVSADK